MSEHRVLEHLQELGLTEYQSRAYLAAVKLGRARPTDLAEESGVPQARIYDVVDDLAMEGLVEVRSKRQGKEVTAPSPDTVLEEFKHRRMDELSETVSTVSADLERFHDRTEDDPDTSVTMVNREESALRHARQAIEQAEWWLTVSIEARLYPDLAESLAAALDRGVTVCLLLLGDGGLNSFDFPDALRVRHRKTADTFIAADRTYGVFSSKHPAKSGQPYIITRDPNLVLLFQNYSEQIWPASRVVQAGDDSQRRYLDPWHAIIDLADQLDNDTELSATVRGTDTATHRKGTWEGTVVDSQLRGPVEADYTVLLPVEATITLATDDGEVTIGGWKATLEDVAADGLEISRR